MSALLQIAGKLDPVTVQKIKRSCLLGLSGFIIGAVPIIMNDPNVVSFLSQHPLVGVGIGSFVPVIINSVKQWRAGQPQDLVAPTI